MAARIKTPLTFSFSIYSTELTPLMLRIKALHPLHLISIQKEEGNGR
jgi:hypothetical protein